MPDVPDVPAPPPERITERVVEVARVRSAEPPQPAPEPAPAPAEAPPEAPRPRSDPPVIRIGRIEVTRAAPPAPPAPPPAPPARPESPQRAALAPRTKPASGLTDYLGWKKR